MSTIRVMVMCSLGCAVLFAIFSLVFNFGDWPRFASVSAAGLFVGLIGAPEIKPKAFKNASAFQSFGGAAAGALIGVAITLSPQSIATGALIGGVLGWLAPYWLKHVPIP